MDLDDLARHVGPDLFARACRAAKATAPGTGTHPTPPHTGDADSDTSTDDEAEADVPHELADLVEGDPDLAIAQYRVMPCYATLMYLEGWSPRTDLYDHLQRLLDDPDDALADPPRTGCGVGLSKPTTPPPPPRGKPSPPTRPTGASNDSSPSPGPCRGRPRTRRSRPWSPSPRWAPALREALDHAESNYFGRTDQAAAARLRERLRGLDG